MGTPAPLSFTCSAAARVAGAGAYLLVAGILLAAIEARGSARARAAPAPAPAATPAPRSASLALTSTYAVGRWTVEIEGVTQSPSAATAQGWHGRVVLTSPSAELFIHGEAADPLSSAPCALQVAIDDGSGPVRSQVLWGEGSVSARLPLLPAAGP